MSLWWPTAMTHDALYGNEPWDTWFYRKITNYAWGWPVGYYWFRKISASGGHKMQLAIRSPDDRISAIGYTVKKDQIYVCCYEDDTPNWGVTRRFIQISPPCGNWRTDFWEVEEIPSVTRSQTYGVRAAVQSNPEKQAQIVAAIATNVNLPCGISATIQGNPELDVGIRAAILGNPELEHPVRAAIRAERLLEPSIIAAVGKDFSLPTSVTATIQGNPQARYYLRAAIKGDTEKKVGIIAYVVKSRVPQIILEMENLWPQECDLRSTPNHPSKFKDWRKESFGK